MKEILLADFQSGQKTANAAASILVSKNAGFLIPTAKQKLNLLVAFAKRNKVVYGKAFDIVKLSEPLNLSDLAEVEKHLERLKVYEIKSTRKVLRPDFTGFFFGLTAAEVLVAQSLKSQFGFVLVNTRTNAHLEMTLPQIFARAKGIYPTWSIYF